MGQWGSGKAAQPSSKSRRLPLRQFVQRLAMSRQRGETIPPPPPPSERTTSRLGVCQEVTVICYFTSVRRSPGQRPRGWAQAHRLMLHHLQRQSKLSRNRLWTGPIMAMGPHRVQQFHHRLSMEMMIFATPTSNSCRPVQRIFSKEGHASLVCSILKTIVIT